MLLLETTGQQGLFYCFRVILCLAGKDLVKKNHFVNTNNVLNQSTVFIVREREKRKEAIAANIKMPCSHKFTVHNLLDRPFKTTVYYIKSHSHAA